MNEDRDVLRALGRIEGQLDLLREDIRRVGSATDRLTRELYDALNSINPRLEALEKDVGALKPAVGSFTKLVGLATAGGAALGSLLPYLKGFIQ